MDIKGGVVIVTGSATGVGAACAQMLAAKGCNVVINYTKSEAEAKETQAACEKLGVETLLCQADVSKDEDCRRMANAAIAKWGRIDGLINNAGTTHFVNHANLEGLSADDFQRIYAVNVIGPYQMTRAVAEQMKKQGNGAVVNVSSVAGIGGSSPCFAYGATKWAVRGMTRGAAQELGPFGIRVNAILPGTIESRMIEGIDREVLRSSIPLGRIGAREDVARLTLWLASDESGYASGADFLMDGGSSA